MGMDRCDWRRMTVKEKFCSLPKVKQQAFVNAGYRVFLPNFRKNSPMGETARRGRHPPITAVARFSQQKEPYRALSRAAASGLRETVQHRSVTGSRPEQRFTELLPFGEKCLSAKGVRTVWRLSKQRG